MLINRWEQASRKFADLAEEFPASKLEFKPSEDVRTVGDVLRHVAFWNQYVAETIRGKEADGNANELPKSKYGTKARILEELRRSADEGTAAMKEQRNGLSPEQMETVASFTEHTCEHYGQLVAYARMNGIVPPASRVQEQQEVMS